MTWFAGLNAIDFVVALTGALLAGFVTGFAGFGTGLVASGLWLHVMPASSVPPLVLLVSICGQLFAMRYLSIGLRRGLAFASPLVVSGAIGIPFGVLALSNIAPDNLKLSVGLMMIAYVFWQLVGPTQVNQRSIRGPVAESAAGLCGGFLGGFAGIPGPVPLIFLQLRGGTARAAARGLPPLQPRHVVCRLPRIRLVRAPRLGRRRYVGNMPSRNADRRADRFKGVPWGHVWTTPALQEESGVLLAVGCKSCFRPVRAAT